MAQSLPLVKLAGVQKEYPGPGGSRVSVLKDVSLEIQPGESVAIVGPSGSGKSTLLQIIGSLDQATAGEVLLEGLPQGPARTRTRIFHPLPDRDRSQSPLPL